MASKELTPRQEKFCQEYMVDLNGTQAAIRAGFGKAGASAEAARTLAIVKVSERIAQLKAAVVKRTEISVDYVLSGLKEVAERCMQHTPVTEWDYINRMKVQKTDDLGVGLWEFDSQGATRALELLGKHVGAFEADNSQKKSVFNVNIPDEL